MRMKDLTAFARRFQAGLARQGKDVEVIALESLPGAIGAAARRARQRGIPETDAQVAIIVKSPSGNDARVYVLFDMTHELGLDDGAAGAEPTKG